MSPKPAQAEVQRERILKATVLLGDLVQMPDGQIGLILCKSSRLDLDFTILITNKKQVRLIEVDEGYIFCWCDLICRM